MAKIELPPTKSSLRKIKEDLEFAYEGHDLLNQKRELLAFEIVRKIGKIREIEGKFLEVLNDLYDAYRKAAVDMGSQVIALKTCAEKKPYTLNLQFGKFMGLKMPKFDFGLAPSKPLNGFAGTTAAYDMAKEKSNRAIRFLSEYSGHTKEIIMLSKELKKVQRRVNSLEKVFIPPNEESKKYIADRIEEMEREEIFVKKLLRQRTSKGKEVS
jgi:V/A-type H+/Na+-transporting ATPase subunit D